MNLSPKDQKWLADNEHLLPRMDRGEKIGRKRVVYFDELIPERLSGLRTGCESESFAPIGSHAIHETLFQVASRVLSPIEAFVLSRMCSGLKQREIAKETGIDQRHITRIIKRAIHKIRKAIHQFGPS